jgi:hypothetical protein
MLVYWPRLVSVAGGGQQRRPHPNTPTAQQVKLRDAVDGTTEVTGALRLFALLSPKAVNCSRVIEE